MGYWIGRCFDLCAVIWPADLVLSDETDWWIDGVGLHVQQGRCAPSSCVCCEDDGETSFVCSKFLSDRTVGFLATADHIEVRVCRPPMHPGPGLCRRSRR